MKANLVAFVSGVLFAIGLAVAGMTQPQKVAGFLDVTGDWDASLGFVMAGGLAVVIVTWRVARRMGRPLWGPRFPLFPRDVLDARLIAGAALFGVGWGLSGFCPGPAFVALGAGMKSAFLFVPAMVAGLFLGNVFDGRAAKKAALAMTAEAVAISPTDSTVSCG